MISLITPPRDQIPRVAKMLADEYGTASNIKSRVNRLSVLSAITSVQARLKLYNKGIINRNNTLFKYVFCFKYRTMDLLFIVER
jgi:peptide subunit release factor 1 (eRF1)